MDDFDRLDWAAGVAFTGDGVRIGIRATDAAFLERVFPHLPPGWRPSRSPLVDDLYSLRRCDSPSGLQNGAGYCLFAGPNLVHSSLDVEVVLDTLESELRFQAAVRAHRRLFVHAGAVGWRGRAILIPGPSMSGKSSLVAALVRAGAVYYSDEFAVLDRRGRVHPYPKLISLREGHGRPSRKLSPEALGGRAGTRPIPVGLVLVTAYRRGSRWNPQLLTPAQALLALVENTLLARERPDFVLHTLREVVRQAQALKSSRGEARLLIEALLKPKVRGGEGVGTLAELAKRGRTHAA